MSPAGLKAIAEEVGLELVVVCGHNMGDIFRRNALNLGLHVVQSPEAVADARDGDELEFEPASRRLRNVTQGKDYVPLPLTPKEDEIRQSGGIFAAGRRELRPFGRRRRPSIEWPDPERARTMTATEQILWAHRVDKDAAVTPGATLRVYADLLPASDGTAPFAIHTFNQITGGHTIDPRQAAIANDHFVFTGRDDDEKQTAIGRAFAAQHGIEPPYYATPGDGIFHFYFPEQGLVFPGQFIPGRRLAQPRVRRVRRRRHRRRLDDARLRVGDGLRLRHARARAPRRVHRDASSPGSAARTSSSSCSAGGAPSRRRGCRWSSSIATGRSRCRIATRSPT